jgi:hypothetical protein
VAVIFSKKQDILFECFDSRTLVFDLNKNLPYELDEIASCIFMHTDGKTDQKAIAEKICEEYRVEFYQALHDIKGLHEDLHQKGIIEPVEG